MLFRSIEQVRRVFRILGGFTLFGGWRGHVFHARSGLGGDFLWSNLAGGRVCVGATIDGPHEAGRQPHQINRVEVG